MNINDTLADDLVHNAVRLERRKRTTARRIIRLLRDVNDDVLAQIAAEGLTDFQARRLNALSRRIQDLMRAGYARVLEEFEGELTGFVENEIQSLTRIHNRVVGTDWAVTPSPQAVYAAAYARPYQGRLLREYYRDLPDNLSRSITQQIRIGYLEGETQNQVNARVRRITNRRQTNFNRSLVNTTLSHFAAFAARRFTEANRDAFSGVKLTATLDTRTSDICKERDGRVYDIDRAPNLPFHFNERSIYVNQLKRWQNQNFDVPERTRASMDGQVAGDLNYRQWIDRQSFSRQSEALGRNRALFLRDGGISVDDLFGRDRLLSNLELARANPQAWFDAVGSLPQGVILPQ